MAVIIEQYVFGEQSSNSDFRTYALGKGRNTDLFLPNFWYNGKVNSDF